VTTRIYLVDDHSMTRAGLRSLLTSIDGLEVVGDDGDARRATEAIAQLRPDLVLLDITMPGLSGIDAIPMIHAVHARARVVMLTHHEGGSFVEQALQRGAAGYLSKDSEAEELALAVRAVMKGQSYVSPKVMGGLLHATRGEAHSGVGLASLTPREREVFQLLAIGLCNKEVARKLDMSLGTAKKHRENLQRKLDCHSGAGLARRAFREGLLEE
jgi:DNA-binding NarL/FixJ family response regulator